MTCHRRSSRYAGVRAWSSLTNRLECGWLYKMQLRHTLREAEGPHILPKGKGMCKSMDLTCWSGKWKIARRTKVVQSGGIFLESANSSRVPSCRSGKDESSVLVTCMYIRTDMPFEMADRANYKPIGIEAHLCFASFGAELRDCSVIW